MKLDKKYYWNIEVLHPNGTPMFHCNFKRAKWYLDRKLAIEINENCIQLTFQPAGPGHVSEQYYLTKKQNICVVCGKKSNLSQHHIVPRCYRRNFPNIFKDCRSHDILILCDKCHPKYERAASKLKTIIALEYGYETQGAGVEIRDTERLKVISHAVALKRHRSKIPPFRQEYLEGKIACFLNKEYITSEDIEVLAKQRGLKIPLNKRLSAKIVAQIEDFDPFVKRWRQHFLDVMKPRFLPEHWSVDHCLTNPDSP